MMQRQSCCLDYYYSNQISYFAFAMAAINAVSEVAVNASLQDAIRGIVGAGANCEAANGRGALAAGDAEGFDVLAWRPDQGAPCVPCSLAPTAGLTGGRRLATADDGSLGTTAAVH